MKKNVVPPLKCGRIKDNRTAGILQESIEYHWATTPKEAKYS